MKNQSLDENPGTRFKPVPFDDGFLFSTAEILNSDQRVINNLSDQDYIHNHKKIENQLDYVTCDLRLGNYPVHRNYLRLVYSTFSPHEHGLRKNDVEKKGSTTFSMVCKYLEKIISGDNSQNVCDSMALGTKLYLEVIWYYMEIFISLSASLAERVSYAALVVTFLEIWRNYVVLHPEMNLSTNFITRETYQDLLSCHFSVILISTFGELYPYLECPLHLTGSDCCEVYFSSNGSFVINNHTYTILEMVQNLTSMNRLNLIKARNKNIRYRKAHSKQDNIWFKQYKEDRQRLINEVHNLLKCYPSESEMLISWQRGVAMAQEIAKKLELDKVPIAGDDVTYFQKPFSKFSSWYGCNDMATEPVAPVDENVNDSENIGYDSGVLTNRITDDSEDDTDENIESALLAECSTALQNEISDENSEQRSNSSIVSPKMFVPDIDVYVYKAKIATEFFHHKEVYSDRLKRITGAGKTAESLVVVSPENRKKVISLFDFVAVKDDNETGFFITRILRMTRMGSRKVNYILPITLDVDTDVEQMIFYFRLQT